MRNPLALIAATFVTAILIAAVWFWTSSPRVVAAAAPAAIKPAQVDKPATSAKSASESDITGSIAARPAAPAPQTTAAIAQPTGAPCANPDALGVSRVVEVDTTGGPGFGFEHFKQLDFLADKEVVLTFDDGPWPGNTPAVLKALADQCTKAVFFPIGKHATYHPEILKQVAAAGHTIGAHTWSHANLNSKKLTEQRTKEEIEKGFSAVKWALGAPPA